MAVNIGIDFCDDYIIAYNSAEKGMVNVPAVVCRSKKEDVWYIGESAYRIALSGSGVLTDKLISLLKKHGTSTIARRAYTAEMLIAKLFENVLTKLLNGKTLSDIDRLVISIKKADKQLMDGVKAAAVSAGIEPGKILIISHQESFIHYMMAQDRELYFNLVGLFDFTGEDLSFYNLRVIRGSGKNSVVADETDLEESFRIGILKNDSGEVLADKIMTETAKKCLSGNIYSSVMLTGKGFERTDWAKGFIEFICKKRRVLYEAGLFAIGSAIYADKLDLKEPQDYLMFCDTRTTAEISIKVVINDRNSKLILIPAGVPWYGADTYAEVIPKGEQAITIDIDSVDKFKPKKTLNIPLEGFPVRPDRCTRVSVSICYNTAEELKINIKDRGFGDLFPASDCEITEVVNV